MPDQLAGEVREGVGRGRIHQRPRGHRSHCRRVVRAGNVHGERRGAGGTVRIGGLHRERVGVGARRQRVDRVGIGCVVVGAIGVDRQRAVVARDRRRCVALGIEHGIGQCCRLAGVGIGPDQLAGEVREGVGRGRIQQRPRGHCSQCRRIVRARNRDGDLRRVGTAAVVVERDGGDHRRGLALPEEIKGAVGDRIAPADGAVVLVAGLLQRQRVFERGDLVRRQRQSRGVVGGEPSHVLVGDLRGRPLGQIDVGEIDGAGAARRRVCCAVAGFVIKFGEAHARRRLGGIKGRSVVGGIERDQRAAMAVAAAGEMRVAVVLTGELHRDAVAVGIADDEIAGLGIVGRGGTAVELDGRQVELVGGSKACDRPAKARRVDPELGAAAVEGDRLRHRGVDIERRIGIDGDRAGSG